MMKILLLGEYSGLHNELKSGLVDLGHQVTLAASNDFWKKMPVDISLGHGSNIYSYKLRQLLYPLLNKHKLKGYDVVHVINPYIMPRSLLLNKLLMQYLKENNSIVTLSGAGDEPFFVNYSEAIMRYTPIPALEKYDLKKKYYMRGEKNINHMHDIAGMVDRIIPIMYEYYSAFVYAGYEGKTVKPIPIPINAKKYDCDIVQDSNNKLTFFHGINRPGFKGTHIVQSVFEEYSKKYATDAEFLCWGRVPFEQYIQDMSRVNIVVDQLYSYSLGMNALFSMAKGKVVMGGNEKESHILYDGDIPPVFNVEPDKESLRNIIDNIMDNREQISDWSKVSREFVIKYHDCIGVAEKYLYVWSGLLS